MNNTSRNDKNENGIPFEDESCSTSKPGASAMASELPFQNRPSPIAMSRMASDFVDTMSQLPSAEDRPMAHLAWMAFLAARSARTDYGRRCALQELAAAVAKINDVALRDCLLDEQCTELTMEQRYEYEELVRPSLSLGQTPTIQQSVAAEFEADCRRENMIADSRSPRSPSVKTNLSYRLAALVALIAIGLGSLLLQHTRSLEPQLNNPVISKAHDEQPAKPVGVDAKPRRDKSRKPIEEGRLPSTTIVELDPSDDRGAPTHVITNQQPQPERPAVRSPNVEFSWFDEDVLPKKVERVEEVDVRIINSSFGTAVIDERPDRAAEQNAIALLRDAETSFGPNSYNAARRIAELASIYSRRCDYSKAAPLYKRQLEILKAESPPKTGEIMGCADKLAQTYLEMDRFDDAIPLFEELLAGYEERLGTNNGMTRACLNRLGKAHLENGDYAEATAMFERVLKAEEANTGTSSPDFAGHCDHLALAKIGQNDLQGARTLFERAAVIRKAVCLPTDPSLAISENSLGILCKAERKYPEAKTHFIECRAIAKRTLGEQHTVSLTACDNLAKIHWLLGEYEDAIALLKQSLAIRREILGPLDRHTLATQRLIREVMEASNAAKKISP